MDRYRIPLPNGRSTTVSAEQVGQIAIGLGGDMDPSPAGEQLPAIVKALRQLPPHERANALSVVLMRFGDKQDIESISRSCQLEPWQVWQLEEAFRQALADVQEPASAAEAKLAQQLEASDTARVMASDMLANALAHGDSVDLDREHEASLRAPKQR